MPARSTRLPSSRPVAGARRKRGTMSLFGAVRWLLRTPQPRFQRARAVELARGELDRRGWAYYEPVAVDELRTWLVWMDSRVKGGIFVVINQQTGAVEKCSAILR